GGDRLGALHVRVCGHERAVLVQRFGVAEDDVLKPADMGVEHDTRIHRPEARRRGDLIVPAASGVQFGRQVYDLLVEKAVDHRVYVFVGRHGRGAGFEACGYRVESALDALAFLDRQDARAPQGNGPRLGQAHVERPETKVDADGAVERVEGGRCVSGE